MEFISKKALAWHNTYLDIAKTLAQHSHAIKKKVGCVIISGDSIISYGYNGTPNGFDNSCEVVETDSTTNTTTFTTKAEVIHAEINAIAKAAKLGIRTNGSNMYVTYAPCVECAKLIVQSGIQCVYYREEHKINKAGIELLIKAKIPCLKMPSNGEL